VVLIAGLQGEFGFAMMWAAVFFSLDVSFGALMFFSFLQGSAQAWGDVATIPLLAASFPNHKGTAIGFSKGFVGLGGAIFAQLYAGFFKPNVTIFVIMCAVIFGIFSTFGVCFMKDGSVLLTILSILWLVATLLGLFILSVAL
jgi:hypothetical protein